MNTPMFPGATEFSLVSLYNDLETSCCGGTPHLHTACTEAYIGMSGAGRVEFLSTQGHGQYPIAPGQVVCFSPGVIHRGIPDSKETEVLVLMQNAGLPEAGDAVLTLPSRYWDHPDEHPSVMSLEADTVAAKQDLVRRRRALALEGFGELLRMFDAEGPPGLNAFYEYARAVVAPRLEVMQGLVERTAARELETTLASLASMRSGSIRHLHDGRVAHTNHGSARFGMCGILRPFRSAASRTADRDREDH